MVSEEQGECRYFTSLKGPALVSRVLGITMPGPVESAIDKPTVALSCRSFELCLPVPMRSHAPILYGLTEIIHLFQAISRPLGIHSKFTMQQISLLNSYLDIYCCYLLKYIPFQARLFDSGKNDSVSI